MVSLALFQAGIILLGVFIIHIPHISAAEFHVPDDYATIQAAIDVSFDGGKIIVHQGVYGENIQFSGKAITIKSTDPNDPDVVAATIIDGNQAGSVVTFNQEEGSNSVLCGFTIRNGKAAYGGGIYCSSSSPTISKCIITENAAVDFVSPPIGGVGWATSSGCGGGIVCDNSSPIITACTINDNSTNYSGGGIYCVFSTPVITLKLLLMAEESYAISLRR